MKRSDMVKFLEAVIDDLPINANNKQHADAILNHLEQAGMLPPDTVTTTYTNEWEPEDEPT